VRTWLYEAKSFIMQIVQSNSKTQAKQLTKNRHKKIAIHKSKYGILYTAIS